MTLSRSSGPIPAHTFLRRAPEPRRISWAQLFRLSLKLDLVHVPFNSGALAIASTLAGFTPVCFGTPPPALPYFKDGKLRALAVTSKARVPTLPDVPTMAEAGYPDVEGVSWFAVAVPAGTPKEIVALLNREIVKIMALPGHQGTLGDARL